MRTRQPTVLELVLTQQGSLRFPNGLSHARLCSVRGPCADRMPRDRRRPDLIAARCHRLVRGGRPSQAGLRRLSRRSHQWRALDHADYVNPGWGEYLARGPRIGHLLPPQSLWRYRARRHEDRRPRRETDPRAAASSDHIIGRNTLRAVSRDKEAAAKYLRA